jgi:hypothetical protein
VDWSRPVWLSRKQRRSLHQPRLRRESYGELIQIDGSQHSWFEDRGDPCTLLVFIDDATSKLMQLRFVPSESTGSYFEPLLERSERSEGLGDKYVDLHEFPDGRLEIRSKGHLLPYRLLNKDQRGSHTAVVENKRLSYALTIIRAQQDVRREPKVRRLGC